MWGAGIDECLKASIPDKASDLDNDAVTNEKVDLYYHHNSLGSVVAVTNAAGVVVESYRYAAFGKPTIYDEGGSEIATTYVEQPFLFTGARWDFEEGSGLYQMRLRYYDPVVGRFVSRDPLGLWGDSSQNGNGQAYCGHDPINRIDPMGLDATTKELRELADALRAARNGTKTMGGKLGLPVAESALTILGLALEAAELAISNSSLKGVTDDLALTQCPYELSNGIPTLWTWLGDMIDGTDYKSEWNAWKTRERAAADAATRKNQETAYEGNFRLAHGRDMTAAERQALREAMDRGLNPISAQDSAQVDSVVDQATRLEEQWSWIWDKHEDQFTNAGLKGPEDLPGIAEGVKANPGVETKPLSNGRTAYRSPDGWVLIEHEGGWPGTMLDGTATGNAGFWESLR